MLMTKQMFFKTVFEKIKTDNSYLNVILQIIHDFELDGTEVGEWVKENQILVNYIADEFKMKEKNINDFF